MSTRVTIAALRWVLTIVGCLVFVGAIAWIATFPVSLAVDPLRRMAADG